MAKESKNKNRRSKYIRRIIKNKNNTVAFFFDAEKVKKHIEDIALNKNRIGYLVIEGFCLSKEISKHIHEKRNLALLISKGKIKRLFIEHNLTSQEIVDAIGKSATSPEAIVFDELRCSYQFYVKLKNSVGYRVVIAFDVVPEGMDNIKANVLTTIFKNESYCKRLESIKNNKISFQRLIYKKKSGWASFATDSS